LLSSSGEPATRVSERGGLLCGVSRAGGAGVFADGRARRFSGRDGCWAEIVGIVHLNGRDVVGVAEAGLVRLPLTLWCGLGKSDDV
jgi:hypothetical protein